VCLKSTALEQRRHRYESNGCRWTKGSLWRVVELLVAAVVAVSAGAAIVCALKGKWAFFFLSILLWPVVPVIGAIRIAKPTSWWARRYYDTEKRRQARERFPYDTVGPRSSPENRKGPSRI
jgi:hypothetical protein